MSKCVYANICPCDSEYYETHCDNPKKDRPDGLCAAYIMAAYLKLEEDTIKLKGKMFDSAFDRQRRKGKGDESTAD